MIKNAILGAGQVATVVQSILKTDSFLYDKGSWEGIEKPRFEYLHVCIPYSEDFVYIVSDAINQFFPLKATIIHSTVKPGTSEKLGESVLYSPITGRHKDDFNKNIRNYTKYFAGSNEKYLQMVKDDLYDNTYHIEYWGDFKEELEYAKIMSTSYMYWNLIYQKEIAKDCHDNHYNFTKVYTKWNCNYNLGIRKQHPEWQRPVYDYVAKDELPGGHCLRPNIHLVDNWIHNKIKEWE